MYPRKLLYSCTTGDIHRNALNRTAYNSIKVDIQMAILKKDEEHVVCLRSRVVDSCAESTDCETHEPRSVLSDKSK